MIFWFTGAHCGLAVRDRNRELLDAEEGRSSENPRAAKRQKAVRNVLELSDDEAAIAAALPSVRASANEVQGELSSKEGDEMGQRPEEDEDLHADLEGINVDDVDIEMESRPEEGELSNQVFLIFLSPCPLTHLLF